MSLSHLATLYLPAIEDELRQVVGTDAALLHDYYAMLHYHLGWDSAQGGPPSGKRVRPLLCLLACAAVGGDWRAALPMAASLELLHNFTLIHDDIQDNSPLRHGCPTVWRHWGVAQAINAGDAMFTLAQLAPHRLSALGQMPELVVEALAELNRTCLTLTQGQYLDMSFEARGQVTVAEYLTMIEAKTGVLISVAAYLGARLGGANPLRAAHFRAYGLNLGLAFQVADDLLGIWGDPAVTGKSAASDLEKRKKSLPVVYGLEHAPDFARAYAQPHTVTHDLTAMALQLEQTGARAFTQTKAEALTALAVQQLEFADPAGEAGWALGELTDQLLKRSF